MFRKMRSKHRRGVVAVEFAFVAPILVAIVVGMIELTRVYDAQYMLQSAAREGARFAAMDRDGLLQEGQTANSKVTKDIKSFLASAGIDKDSVTVTILDHDDSSKVFNLDDPANDLKLFDLAVKVSYSDLSYTTVNVDSDYDLVGTITFRNGRATISQ